MKQVQAGEQHGELEPTLDRAAAEQALLIAARLQHEHKERLSLSELKRTAAEVDIEPGFVDQALTLMSRPADQKPKLERLPAEQAALDVLAVFANVALGLVIFIVQVIAWYGVTRYSFAQEVPVWVAAAVVAGLLGFFLPRSRRWPQVLAVAVLAGTVLDLLMFWPTFGRVHVSHWDVLIRTGFLIALEAAVFYYSQKVAELTRKEPLRADFQADTPRLRT